MNRGTLNAMWGGVGWGAPVCNQPLLLASLLGRAHYYPCCPWGHTPLCWSHCYVCEELGLDKVADMAASRSFGVLLYCRKADLCHWPRVRIIEASTPTMAPIVFRMLRCFWEWRMAVTGHSSVCVMPTTMSAPDPNWSHLDFFKWICIIRGAAWLSTATSPHMSPTV